MTFAAPWLVLSAIVGCVSSQILQKGIVARQGDSTQLVFRDFGQLTTCSPSLIRWFYFGPDEVLSLYISNLGVSQLPSTTSKPPTTATNTFIARQPNLRPREEIYRPIDLSLRADNEQYNWTVVDVPAGFYVINAYIASAPAYQTQSSSFLVQQGNDDSCLSTNLPTSSSSSNSPPATSITSSSTLAPSSSGILLPSTPVGASSSSTNKGAIAGGVVAGVVVLAIATALYFLFVRRPQRSRTRQRTTSSFLKGTSVSAKGDGGRWGGLSSVDSHMIMNDTAYTNHQARKGRHHAQPESLGHNTGAVNAPRNGSQTYLSGNRSLAGSITQQYTDLDDEKFLEPDETAPVVPGLEVPGQPRRPSTESAASNALSPFATPPAASPIGLARAPSTGSTMESPATSHRTPRKPVPAYIPDPSVESPSASTPVSPYIGSGSPFDPPSTLPSAGGGHYVTRAERESLKLTSAGDKKSKRRRSKGRDKAGTRVGDSPNGSSEDMQHNLAHKNSFGPGSVEGKPLHYLIPDMPAGQQ